jgi:diguanylate cyclase (GGDEF)-like protein
MASALSAIVMYHVANPRLLIWDYQHWDIVQVALFIAVGSVTAKLVADSHRLNVLATTDDLTGLHNLRSFETHLVALVRDCRKTGTPLAVLVLDVDRLKSLNDVHGHLTGAEAVRAIGHIIGACVPANGVACRYGGDEFVIAVPDCTDTDPRALGDQLRRDVQSMAPDLAGVSFPPGTLSVSVGVASHVFGAHDGSQSDAALGERLFREADRALYHAKEHGRNLVHVA